MMRQPFSCDLSGGGWGDAFLCVLSLDEAMREHLFHDGTTAIDFPPIRIENLPLALLAGSKNVFRLSFFSVDYKHAQVSTVSVIH